MKTMAAMAAPPSRAAAPPSEAAGPDTSSAGSFAAVLGQARDPIKAAVDRAAKSPQPRATPAAEPRAAAKPGSGATRESVHDADAEHDGAATATDAADVTAATAADEMALPVPGGTAPAAIPQSVGADLVSALAVTPGHGDAALALDSTLWLDEGAPLATALTPGKPRTFKAPLSALAPTDVAPGKTDAAAATATAATAAATAAAAGPLPLPAAAAKPATDAAAMSVPTLSALSAPLTHATPAAPATVGTAAALPFAAHLAAAVNSPAFAPALATQVSWLVQEGQQHARLTLNPADLGPVAVRITLEGTQARIDFHAAVASTRAAIEASLPTLAAALHDNGMTLAGGGVSDDQPRPGTQGDRAHSDQGLVERGAGDEAADLHATLLPLRPARGLVDLVA